MADRPSSSLASRGIQRYGSRVRIFLVGIVMALLATTLVNAFMVRRVLDDLRAAHEDEVRSSTERFLERQDVQRLRREMARWERDNAELPRLRRVGARRGDPAGVQVLSPDGLVLAEAWDRQGEEPRAYEVLDRPLEQALRRGETRVVWPAEGDRVEVFTPLLASDGAFLGAMRLAYDASTIRSDIRGYRLVLWLQAAAVLVLLVITLAFARWLLRPLRLVQMTTAGEEIPSGEKDPTRFLLDTYRKMIADLRDKEEELRRLRGQDRRRASRLHALNRSIMDSLLEGIVVFRPDGTVWEANGPSGEILGFRSSEATGRPLGQVLEPWPELVTAVRRCLEEGEEAPLVETRRGRGGQVRWVEASVSPLRGEGGGALLLASDRTRVRELENQMRRREMLADLGELSAGVAHEFRNALGTILGYARMLRRREKNLQEAEAIEKEVHSLERVVRDFLRFADPTRLVLTELDLEELIEELAREVGRPGVAMEVEGSLPRIRGDETLLRRTFRNLLRNAVEAIPPEREGRVVARGQVVNGRVEIAIEDDGTGMDDEVRERLFQPFFTTKPGGTGLGLALVQKIVLSHNGDITCEPAPGGGTVFRVVLPIHHGEERGEAAGV